MKTAKVKSVVLIAAMAGALLMVSPQARADNQVNWSFVNLTTSPLPSDNPNDLLWDSPTFIDTGWAQYNYSYQITKLEAYVNIFSWGWLDITSEIPAEDLIGSGSQIGSPPWVLADELFEYPEGSGSAISAHVNINVDAGGQGHLNITDIFLGVYEYEPLSLTVDLGGVRLNGTIDIVGVPEPMSIMLLACGALAFVARRRR